MGPEWRWDRCGDDPFGGYRVKGYGVFHLRVPAPVLEKKMMIQDSSWIPLRYSGTLIRVQTRELCCFMKTTNRIGVCRGPG